MLSMLRYRSMKNPLFKYIKTYTKKKYEQYGPKYAAQCVAIFLYGGWVAWSIRETLTAITPSEILVPLCLIAGSLLALWLYTCRKMYPDSLIEPKAPVLDRPKNSSDVDKYIKAKQAYYNVLFTQTILEKAFRKGILIFVAGVLCQVFLVAM